MKITKYEHACLDIEEGGQRLLIDPGAYTTSISDFGKIAAVVVTHAHADHFDLENLQKVADANPDVKIFTTAEVAEQLKLPGVEVVQPDQAYSAGSFQLEFFGKDHAVVIAGSPVAQNVGVLVNDTLYYPGDSFTDTDATKPYQVLALPTMAPWAKLSETAAFLNDSPATTVFPTHNGFLNDSGNQLYEMMLDPASKKLGKTYQHLSLGESLAI